MQVRLVYRSPPWYIIQMTSGTTFGPSHVTTEERLVGAVAMIVGTVLTGIYVSTIAVWYITRRIVGRKSDLDQETKYGIISKINGLEELRKT